MLENIKSFYITKTIFSFSNEKNKFKLIKYNKSLQKKINLDITNYKQFSGRYIIYESEGVGKEYLTKNNKLIYEGEFFNGERIKGKEYRNFNNNNYNVFNELIFEGVYWKGKKWNGKGKEYDEYNNCVFEGKYLNGKRWNGKWKKYKYDKYDVTSL